MSCIGWGVETISKFFISVYLSNNKRLIASICESHEIGKTLIISICHISYNVDQLSVIKTVWEAAEHEANDYISQ